MRLHPILRLRRRMRAVRCYNEAWTFWQGRTVFGSAYAGVFTGYLCWAAGEATMQMPLETFR